jgi:glycosyltransferase involved in cell wall biosynthesis
MSSLPIKMFEYMAAGIPVIASDFPLWRELIQESGSGIVVDPFHPKAIAEAISYVLSHPKHAQAMGLCGRRAVETSYNWRHEERQLLDLYNCLLVRRVRPAHCQFPARARL